MNLTGTKPTILSLIAPYSDQYVLKSSVSNFPMLMISVHQPLYTEMQYELLAVCETILLEVTEEMSEMVEKQN